MSQVEDDVIQLFRSKLEADPEVPPSFIDSLITKLAAGKLDASDVLARIESLQE